MTMLTCDQFGAAIKMRISLRQKYLDVGYLRLL